VVFLTFPFTPAGEVRWLETNIIKQPNTMKTLPDRTALPLNITGRAITTRAENTQQTRSNTLKMRASTASRRTPRANNRSS
jgi:hypothetical protein